MSKHFNFVSQETFPIFFFLTIYGVCCGHKRQNERRIIFFVKKIFCKLYGICLLIYMSIISHFITLNKFYIENNAENAVDWSLRISLWIIIPSHLKNGEKYKNVASAIISTYLNPSCLNFRYDIIFVIFYFCLIVCDIIAWCLIYFHLDYWHTLYEYVRSKYESRIHTLTYIKFGLLIRILETALKKFNEELLNQENIIKTVNDSNCEKVVANLIQMKKAYNDLIQHSRVISEIIGLPVIVILTVGITCLATLLYSLLFSTQDEDEPNNKYNIFFYVVANVTSVGYFMNTSTRLSLEVSANTEYYLVSNLTKRKKRISIT